MSRRPIRPRRGKRRRPRVVSARAQAERTWARHYAPADMSKFIRRFEVVVGPGTKVVLWVRVSGDGQSTVDQKRTLRRAVEAVGGDVAGVVVQRRSARVVDEFGTWWRGFAKARRLAEEHDAVLLAESTCRFIRPDHFRHKGKDQVSPDGVVMSGPGAVPGESAADEFRRLVEGIIVATLHDPNDGPRAIRSKQTSRSPRNGRPRKRTHGTAAQQHSLKVRATRAAMRLIEEGASRPEAIRDAAAAAGVSERTVRRGLDAVRSDGVSALERRKRGRPPKVQPPESDD